MTELQILRTMHPPEIFIEQITLLNKEIGRTISSSSLKEIIDALPRSERLLLAVEGDFLVGFAHLRVHSDLAGASSVEVVDLIVRSANRQRGIGRQLLNAAETWARQSDYRSLQIRIPVADSGAHAFLTALQFEQSATLLEFNRHL